MLEFRALKYFDPLTFLLLLLHNLYMRIDNQDAKIC